MSRSLVLQLIALAVVRPAWSQLPVVQEKFGAPASAFGRALAPVGDVDSDAFDDYMVGAPNWANSGAAFICSGKTGLTIRSLFAPASANDYGWSVTGLGDVDGDMVPDFAVGDLAYQGIFVATGAFWVYSGATGAPLFSVIGSHAGGHLGYCVRGAGDLDSDGVRDLLVGEPGAPGGGAIHAYSGSGALLFTVTPAMLAGSLVNGRLGEALSAIGDVTGDGKPDIVIGDPMATVAGVAAGAAYLITTPAPSAPITTLFVGTGSVSGARYGEAVTCGGARHGEPGDLDSDGTPDFVIGAPGGPNGGTVYAISGKAPFSSIFVADASSVVGPSASAGVEYGAHVAGAGDIDGDGAPEVVIGAPKGATISGTTLPAGLVHIVHGTGRSVAVFDAQQTGEQYGRSVSAAGDIDHDGRADLLIGAHLADTSNGIDSGRIEVRSGCPNPPSTYGQGCPTSIATNMALSLLGCVGPNAAAELRIEGGLPGGTALLFLGLNSVSLPMAGGCKLLVGPVLPIILTLPLNGGGALIAPLTLPPTLQPFTVTLQAFGDDPGLVHGFHNSNGVAVSYP